MNPSFQQQSHLHSPSAADTVFPLLHVPAVPRYSLKAVMSSNDWVLVIGLSLPALAVLAWVRLVRNEMKAEMKTKSD